MQVALATSAPRAGASRIAQLQLQSFLKAPEFSAGSRTSADDARPADIESDHRRKEGAAESAGFAALLAADGGALAAQARQNDSLASQSLTRASDLRQQQAVTRRTPQFRAALAEAAQRSPLPAAPANPPSSNAGSEATPQPAEAMNETPAPNPSAAAQARRGASAKVDTATAVSDGPGGGQLAARSTAASQAEARGPATPVQAPAPPNTSSQSTTVAATAAVSATQIPPPVASPGVPSAAAPQASASESSPSVRSASSTPTPASAGPTRGRSPATAPSAAPSTDSGSPTSDAGDFDANLSRILRFVRTRIDGQKSSTVMRLDPPALGTLRLRLDLQQGAARIEIETSTPLAQRLLGEQLDVLRRGLEAAGIRLEHADVRAAGLSETAAPTPDTNNGPADDGSRTFDSSNAFTGHEREAGTEAHDATRRDATFRDGGTAELAAEPGPEAAGALDARRGSGGLNVLA